MLESHLTPPADSRPIPQVPGYCVVDGGTVWSCHKHGPGCGTTDWHVVKPRKLPRGYIQVLLKGGGKNRVFLVHRLVLEAFVGPCPPGCEACHNDGNPANNFVSNLRWDTRTNNHADKKRHGTNPAGERNVGAKLNESDIPEIFRLAKQGRTLEQIATVYKVGFQNIGAILNRQLWSHVHVDADLMVRPDSTLRGERVGTSKLKEADIPEIFRLHRQGLTHERIAGIYGVTFGLIGHILRRKAWTHVPIPSDE